MKLGALLVMYLVFGIWSSTNRIGNVLLGIAVGILICLLISTIGRLIRSDRMVSMWQRCMRNLITVEIIGFVSMITWPLLLKLIF